MTNSKQPNAETTVKQPAETGELSDAALNQVSGAMLACTPATLQTGAHGSGGGGGAGKSTDSAIIAIL